ncbi:phytoene desaturase family protein [Yinghuangia soli]|uniref:FAD-dependent oxidoreductase n=1 Tax=Yinghuangia soli TaxID=2908204 RepID=A0AA41Q5Z7_9ACTN|nr:FAD-dependent oxidoreductase [Yinghuangia soli]MCF2531276.1 FAD-dependent oxidoreductase [Yinghuangia soli]
MARIVVVGAGMGGLAVAARLAVKRHDVTLCERSDAAGGMLRAVAGTDAADGFSFTSGPAVLTLPAVFRDLFLKTGAALEDCVDLVGVDPTTRCSFDRGATVVDIPNATRAGAAAAFEAAFGAGAGADWNRLMDRGAAMWGVMRTGFFEVPAEPDKPRSPAGGLKDFRTTMPWRKLRPFVRGTLRDPRQRAHAERFALDAGLDPRRAPATVAVLPYLEQTFGLWTVRGGLHTMAEALHARCLDLGVKFRMGTEVAEVSEAGGRVDGVVLADGGRLDADAVVWERSAADPAAVPGYLELHLALRGRTAGQPYRTYLFPDDPAAEAAALFGTDADGLPADPTLCVLAPPDRAPEGHEAWTVQVRVPAHGTAGAPGRRLDWTRPDLRESAVQTVLDLMARRGLPVADRLVRHELRTPADLEQAVGAPGGAVAASPVAGGQPNRSPVPGLYAVGASAHPGGGLIGVGMGAASVAELIGKP